MSQTGSVAVRPPTPAEMQAIDQAMRAGNHGLAMHLAGEAAAAGADHLVILTLAACDALQRDAAELALTYATRAKTLAPRDAEVLNVYGQALLECARYEEALVAFDASLRRQPGRAGLHYHKGCAYEELSDTARARTCFQRAVELQPDFAEALSRLAFLAAAGGDLARAKEFAARCLRVKPGDAAATLALAQAEVEEKSYAAALARLERIRRGPTGVDASLAEGLCADALDGLGRRDEAFRAYTASNAMRRAMAAPQFANTESALAWTERLDAYFRACPSWPAGPRAATPRTHVFLVGFPRSGTTLLEQVLAAHPDVVTMEERYALKDCAEAFSEPEGRLDQFAALDEDALETWRAAYWARVGEWGIDPKTPVFLDKLPLNTLHLGLIARLFPAAKILVAQRDPADVVWSCFRRRFGMSKLMFEFLTLEGAARFYDAVMRLSATYRAKLALDCFDLRYESLVADFNGETRRICDFLGLAWREDLAGFAAKARARSVNTPSAAQVARGIYASGQGQWRAYAAHLAPVLPILEPWRARFGYA